MVERVGELIQLSKRIKGAKERDIEDDLFAKYDAAKPGLEKGVAFKRWKDHILKHSQ